MDYKLGYSLLTVFVIYTKITLAPIYNFAGSIFFVSSGMLHDAIFTHDVQRNDDD